MGRGARPGKRSAGPGKMLARGGGAEVPEGVAACATVWHHWARRLAEWSEEGG